MLSSQTLFLNRTVSKYVLAQCASPLKFYIICLVVRFSHNIWDLLLGFAIIFFGLATVSRVQVPAEEVIVLQPAAGILNVSKSVFLHTF